MAAMLPGVHFSMVPLLGLGSDQVGSAHRPEKGLQAYHFDEFCEGDFKKLGELILSMTHQSKHSILVYISPQKMASDKPPAHCSGERHSFIVHDR